MRKSLCTAAVLVTVSILAAGAVGGPSPWTGTAASLADGAQAASALGDDGLVTDAALPWCWQVHGKSCTPPATKRCLLAPYEPEICACQGNPPTWNCYW